MDEGEEVRFPKRTVIQSCTCWVKSSAMPGGGAGEPSVDGSILFHRLVAARRRLFCVRAAGRSPPFHATGSGLSERWWLLRSLADCRQPPLHSPGGWQRIQPSPWQLTPARCLEHPWRQTRSATLDGTADSPQRRGLYDSAFLLPPGLALKF